MRWGSGGWSGRLGDRSGRRREEGCGMAGLRNGGRSRNRGQNALDRSLNLGSGEERSLSRCRRERSWWCREERCWRRREERCRWREEGRGGGQRSGSRPALQTLWSDDRVRIEKGWSSSWDRSDEEWSWFGASKKSWARPLIRGCSRCDQRIVLVCPAVAILSAELAICQDEVLAHGFPSLTMRRMTRLTMDSLVREVQVAAAGVRLYMDWRRLVRDNWSVEEAKLLCGPCVRRRLGLARPPLHRVPLPDGLVSLGKEVFVLAL